MQPSARQNYMTTQVMTATPQRLQFLLIDGAVRFCEQARQHWDDKDFGKACGAVIGAQEIVSQILNNLNKEVNAELVEKVSAIYLFIYRSLMESVHRRNIKKLDDAVRVLVIERETWRLVCDQNPAIVAPNAGSGDSASFQSEQPAAPPTAPVLEADPLTLDGYAGGFSLEA